MRMPFRTLVRTTFAAANVIMLLVASGRAQDNAGNKQDVADIRAAAKQYVAALRRGDADAVRQIWTSDGDYIDASGQTFKVHELVSRHPVGKSANADGDDTAVPESTLRIVAPGVAIEDGVCGAATNDDGAASGRFTAVWVKRHGRWQLDGLRESVVVLPASKQRLQSLNWLLGEWAGASEESAILVSSHWSDNGHFILREFVERSGDRDPVSGTQRIGWDAATGKLKCWTFDSQGGTGEGIWRQDGKRWIVETTHVLPNGETATAVTMYTPGDDDHFVWEAPGSKVAGRNVPPRRIELKRAAGE